MEFLNKQFKRTKHLTKTIRTSKRYDVGNKVIRGNKTALKNVHFIEENIFLSCSTTKYESLDIIKIILETFLLFQEKTL